MKTHRRCVKFINEYSKAEQADNRWVARMEMEGVEKIHVKCQNSLKEPKLLTAVRRKHLRAHINFLPNF